LADLAHDRSFERNRIRAGVVGGVVCYDGSIQPEGESRPVKGSAFRMVPRRRRSRRRKSLSSRLRRYLIEHRFNAAQALLGVCALSGSVWLLWPQAQTVGVDHRGLWERSLQTAEQNFEGRTEAFREGLVAVTESSLAMSAKGQVPGWEAQGTTAAGARLAKIARTMPAIGVPDGSAAAMADLAVNLPGHDEAPAAGLVGDLGATARALRGTSANLTMAQLLPHRPPSDLGRRTPTWLRNAVAAPLPDGRPMIAMVIDDLGLRRANTAALIALPGPLTLAFLPYADALEPQTRAARAAGHELLVHVPMEATGHEWPGPNALLSALSPTEMLSRLRAQLRSFPDFVGVNNHMGSLLTADHAEMALVMAELRARELLFLDSRTTAKSVATTEAQRLGVPHAERDVFLDNELGLDYVRRQLVQTEQLARRQGYAVAIGHPHDVTIEALRGWLPSLEERGFALVPISAVVARESCASGLLTLSSACGRYLSAHNTVE
jgi:polysaccharide deacetylase 2 family uncharacterized protein YibQ